MGQTTPICVESIKEMLELPDEAIFGGFLIRCGNRYLRESTDSQEQTERVYVPTPNFAHRYASLVEACKGARSDQGEEVVVLFIFDDDQIISSIIDPLESAGATIH